jgi:hypothetical protein
MRRTEVHTLVIFQRTYFESNDTDYFNLLLDLKCSFYYILNFRTSYKIAYRGRRWPNSTSECSLWGWSGRQELRGMLLG